MALFRPIAALLLIALTACVTTPKPAQRPDYFVMRHLQKEAGQDPGLSPEGRAAAERLSRWFGKDAPAAIYVSTTRRARETAAPLAARLRILPKEYAPADVAGLVERVKAERGTVLIVGHSNTVPDIVERLGGARPAPIPEESFGNIWHVFGTAPTTEKKSLGGS